MHKCYRYGIYGILWVFLAWGLMGCDNRNDTFVHLDTEASVTEENHGEENTGSTEVQPASEVSTENELYVFVCGQVRNPGVYCVPAGSRICDAISAAGGCLETADDCIVNQAERLEDGDKVYIPAVGEEWDLIDEETKEEDGLIHLNRATKEELMTLPGIGESKAEQILAYREEHGVFSSIEELMNISGIKEGVFHGIEDYITVE